MAIIGTDLLVVNRGGIDYKAPASALPEFDSSELEELIAANTLEINDLTEELEKYAKLDDPSQIIYAGKVSANSFHGDGSELTNLPIPIVEGNVLFKGSVDTVSALPDTDNSVGDMWHVNDDDSLHAWGEDGAWHEVGASTDIDLSGYAKLDGEGQEIINTAKFQCQNSRSYLDNTTLKTEQGDFAGAVSCGGNLTVQGNISSEGNVGFNGPVTVDNIIESTQTVTADAFIGDGSQLTNLPATDLSEYAKLDDDEQSITAKEFIGDGSKLTNIKVDLEGGYVGGPLETSPTAPAMVNSNVEGELQNDQIEAGLWGSWVGIFLGLKLVSDAGWVWDSNDGDPNILDEKPTVVYINGTPFDVKVDSKDWGAQFADKVFIPLVGEDFFPELEALVDQQASVSWYPGEAGALDGYAKLYDNQQSITAKEFIGDGSKLTNLPASAVDLSEYATEEWVQGYAMPKDISTLPSLI